MNAIVEYLLSVIGAVMVCCCVTYITEKYDRWSSVIKVLCGVFIAITIIDPLTSLKITNLDFMNSFLPTASETYSTEGLENAKKAQMQFIRERTETYILEKAKSLNCDLEVSVGVSDQAPYAPNSVNFSGLVSPYVKRQITVWIEETLNIPVEEQRWGG